MTTTPTVRSDGRGAHVVLSIENLVIEFPDGRGGSVRAVDGISLQVRRGERVAIVGESGSGKSTLVSAVLGLLVPSARIVGGEILLMGRDARDPRELDQLRGRVVGYVPQDPQSNLDPLIRIGVQVAEGPRAHRLVDRGGAAGRAVELLAGAGVTDPVQRAAAYPHELSGGLRQRALIAIGLSSQPELLIADEPTSALDVTVQKGILDRLEQMVSASGLALLFITHDLAVAAERADRVIVMREGRIVETGSAGEVLSAPQHEYTRELLAAAPALHTASAPEASGESELLLSAQDLRRTFRVGGRETTAVEGVSFHLNAGRTLGIVGESGSGKSTVARMLLRLTEPTSGTVRFDGVDPWTIGGHRLRNFRREVQPVFQDPASSINPSFTAARAIADPLLINGDQDARGRRARVNELADLVGLSRDLLGRHPDELSGGQKQRVAIARALALQPRLVVLDEPVSALDVLVQARIVDLLKRLQRELGVAYVFISHDLAVVRQLAHNVIVMHDGRVVESGPTGEVLGSPKAEYTRLLLDAVPRPAA
ncbi:MAG TPA: ABC transporter ATP-binding protein [Lacisediminihabitans sp.]|uniref:ABC transporter ATP-binding protein n=1 Tax=Lacisediminihabitans sp. TaxID=2787631 RepID=UPI002EDA7434